MSNIQEQHSDRRHDDDHQPNPFLIPFILIFFFAFIEFYVGIWAKSLALLGDAWHMFSDVFALGLAMLASYSARKHQTQSYLHGQSNLEVIASSINAVLMLVVIAWIIKEAIARLYHPEAVASAYVMLVALIGLIINVVVAYRLHHQSDSHAGHENLNHRAALIHVLGDLLGSIAALIAGAVIYLTGWLPIDPILSLFIALLLLGVTLHLIKDIWQHLKREQATLPLPARSHHDSDHTHDHKH